MGFCWVYKRRWITLFASLLFVFGLAFGAKNIVQTADYKVYFDKGDRQLLASEQLSENYSQSDNVLFVVTPKDGVIFTQKNLSAIQSLTEKSWKIPHSTRVDSITNYQNSYAQEDELIIENLVPDDMQLSQADINRIQQIALNEPNLKNRLISENGRVTGVNVTINFDKGQVDSQTREVVAFARNIVTQFKAEHTDMEVYLTGIVLMNNAFPETSEADGATLVPIMLLLILVGLYVLLRSFTAVISTLIVMLLGIAGAMGVAGFLGYKINPVSGAAPIMILTIAIADCVHILMTFISNYRNKGMEKSQSIQNALEVNFKPVVLTTVTTAIGFLSMNFSDAPPFRELGNIVAVGIMVAGLLSITLLPSLLNLLPVKNAKVQGEQNRRLSQALLAIAGFVKRRATLILLLTIAGSLLLSTASLKNELNEDFVRYFDESFDVRQSTEFALKNLTGISVVEYDIKGEGKGKITEPEYLLYLDAFNQWLLLQPEVMHVNSFSDTIKRLNKNLNADKPEYYKIPNDRDLIAQYILLYETSLPFGLGLNDRVKFDKSATRLTVILNDVTNNQLLAFEQRAQEWMRQNFPAHMQSEGLGWSMMFGGVAQKNISSMLNATLIAVLLISAILMVPFRSLKIGIISLIPNVLPALVALGIWGLVVGSIGLAASIITALTFGIVVDDSIHFITHYVRLRKTEQLSMDEAIDKAFASVGKAIVVTSVILSIGFLVLATSGFKVNSIIGYLSAMTVAIALLLDLLLLPSLLIKLDGWLFSEPVKDQPAIKELNSVTP